MPYLSFEAAKRRTNRWEKETPLIYTPEFVGFSEAQKVWMEGFLKTIDFPIYTVKRFVIAETPAGTRASWYLPTREIMIAPDSFKGKNAQYALTRTLVHELTHACFDTLSYKKLDENYEQERDGDGKFVFIPGFFSVFKNPETLAKFEMFRLRLLSQAIETERYLDGYQQFLVHTYLALEGKLHVLTVQMSGAKNTPEQNRAYQADYDRVFAEFETIFYTLFQESWSITMEYALLNPKGLQQKTNAQRRSWKELGKGTDRKVLGKGKEVEFMDTAKMAQRFLETFLDTDAAGVERRRQALKNFLRNPLPAENTVVSE